MPPTDKTLVRAIQNAASRARLSQRELGVATGLHETYISHLWHGRRHPTLRTLQKIADATGLSLSQLLKGVRYAD